MPIVDEYGANMLEGLENEDLQDIQGRIKLLEEEIARLEYDLDISQREEVKKSIQGLNWLENQKKLLQKQNVNFDDMSLTEQGKKVKEALENGKLKDYKVAIENVENNSVEQALKSLKKSLTMWKSALEKRQSSVQIADTF